MSIILGIDPGSRVTGYGVIRQTGRHLEYLGSGAIRTQVEDLPTRLKRIYAGVTESLRNFNLICLQLSKCLWRRMRIQL